MGFFATSQSASQTAPLSRGASGEEERLYEMPKPPLVRGGGSAYALTERLTPKYKNRQRRGKEEKAALPVYENS